ncbi:carbapenem self-resistance protein CarG family protein [Klebsiella sp. BIGb0407]|uniref:carbapenem self-resistance protein CarG family protein n=1 Tax=Klebsiella sp. BIGb0407 TaxID=2940603 RepID=UPI00216A0382|nr:spore coat protein CotH [Klebsiella sp. BIGb0407]MCS3429714.1 hypothetical protein [Klebsiella sp. BIGb0407]
MKKNSLVFLLSLLIPFTVCANNTSKVTLREGVNMLDINGDGIKDLVVYSKFENNTSHPNQTMTIFVVDRQGKYHILPVANDTGFTWSDFILSASTIKIADYALYKKQKGYFIVSAQKKAGGKYGDDMSDALPVKFTRYDMNTDQNAPGVPLYSWEHKSSYVTTEKYPDTDEAFKHFQIEKLK